MKTFDLCPVENNRIRINDHYWNRYVRMIPEKVIPYQWEILHDRVKDAAPSYCIQNFQIAAGEKQGERKGEVFQDTDLYKWLEAVAYCLSDHRSSALEKQADEMIDLIGRAQCSDGYINTYFTLVRPGKRWTNLTQGHELYCAGHLFEAAVAYYEATGKRKLLDISCRFADYIVKVFGPLKGQCHGMPGHPEVELALVRLYRATKNTAYLELAKYFIDVRGTQPNYFSQEIRKKEFEPVYCENKTFESEYYQSHLPVRQQITAEGHAVRAVYLYCAMADIGYLTKDNSLLEACKALWDNIVEKRMYLIGGIGSSGHLERFTTDYDLPNDSGYAETCAAIGLAQFGIRMARITGDASYIDIVERALYNNIRAGIALSGDRYFYVNPMEVWPSICMPNTSRAHVKPTRQRWFDVACCPTNIARTMSSLGQFIYETGNDALVVNLFIANEAEIPVAGGNAKIKLICDYPKSGLIRLQIDGNSCEEFELSLRLPGFAHNHKLFLNGKQISSTPDHGYFRIRRKWKSDSIELFFEIEPVWVCSNVHVRDNIGKLAILRGPEVYCLEEIDNGKELSRVFISPDTDLKEDWDPALMGGTMKLNFTGNLLNKMDNNRLPQFITKKFTAVPYGSWNNRGDGEMVVWLRALWHSKRNKKDTKA